LKNLEQGVTPDLVQIGLWLCNDMNNHKIEECV